MRKIILLALCLLSASVVNHSTCLASEEMPAGDPEVVTAPKEDASKACCCPLRGAVRLGTEHPAAVVSASVLAGLVVTWYACPTVRRSVLGYLRKITPSKILSPKQIYASWFKKNTLKAPTEL